MHIAYNGWFWNQPHTGSGQYVRRLLHSLRRVSPDLHMTLVLPPGHRTPEDLPDDVSLVMTEGRGGNLGKVWFEQRTFPQMVERVAADIAHIPYWGTPLKSPAKIVTSVLDVIPLVYPEYYATGFFPRLYTSLVRAAAHGSAHILTLSENARNDIITHIDVDPDLVMVTHLAADEVYHPRMGAERDAAVREKYNLPDEFVLYLGGFDWRKQVNQLLYAYSYVLDGHDVPLVMAGGEPAWGTKLFPDMRAYADELNISDHVQWIGHVDEEDKPSLYRLARVFVYPSLYEGFGLPVIEAMASGTPVVANEIPIMEEIVGDGAYLVADGSPRRMAGAIIALLLQEPLRESMITQGLSRATQFNWRKTAQQTLEIYQRVMNEG